MNSVPRRSAGYQLLLVGLLSINFGIVFFDRNSLNFLMPFVQPELGLTNTQVGILASALSFTWAIAAFGIGRLSDALGNRKMLLILATVLFSLCSFLTGIAQSFVLLLGARLLMGAAEGGVMPISHAMVATEVTPEKSRARPGRRAEFRIEPARILRRAGAAGVLRQRLRLARGLLPRRHSRAGQRRADLVPDQGARLPPGLRRRKGPQGARARRAQGAQRLAVLRAGIILVAYLVICWAFMPLYLTKVRGFSPNAMSWLMGTLGISAPLASCSFLVAGLSDRIGRRPVMIFMPFLGVILPLGAMYLDGPYWAMVAIFFFGWGLNGIFPLFMATVPSESVSPTRVATALGLCMGSAEVLGGVFGPAIAGAGADAWGLSAPLWLMLGLTIVAGLLALLLNETAPRVLARRSAGGGARTGAILT